MTARLMTLRSAAVMDVQSPSQAFQELSGLSRSGAARTLSEWVKDERIETVPDSNPPRYRATKHDEPPI